MDVDVILELHPDAEGRDTESVHSAVHVHLVTGVNGAQLIIATRIFKHLYNACRLLARKTELDALYTIEM